MRLGISRGHWSDLVNGRHPYPSARTRRQMLEVFGVAERDLFEPAASSPEEFDFRVAIAARFELTSELGQGGMGTVYLAHDLTLSRVVALKMVASEAVAGVGADGLLKEIATVSRLQHPNILPLFDAGERSGSPFYVMPLIRGGSLGARLRSRGRLPLGEVVSLLHGIAAGLHHAHEHQVLHCDVKPENILVQDGHPWVMDFGIARRLHDEAGEWLGVRRELDFSAGTPAYVSPEQARSDLDLDPRSDVFSLACVAYEMLAGRTPFAGDTTQQVVTRRFEESPPSVRRFSPDVPGEVAAVIEQAMSVDRDQRQASALGFARDLQVAAASAGRWRSAATVGATRVIRKARDATLGPLPARMRRSRARAWFAGLRQDVAFALRQRRRSPGLTIMALLTLGLSIGLVTAVFAVVNRVLLQPLPFAEPDRLVSLQSVDSTGNAFDRVSSANWADWQDGARTLEATAIHQGGRVSVVTGTTALRADAQDVSVAFFGTLRARLLSGRGFIEDDVAQRRRVAVLDETFWRRDLGAAPLGSLTIQVNGFAYDVVGVVTAGQGYPDGTDVWMLFRPRRFDSERNNINYSAIARLRPGIRPAEAGRDLSAIARGIQSAAPASLYSWGVAVVPLREQLASGSADLVRLLLGAAGLVLLVACANLASANLAQGAARQSEMAIRAALGAGRRQLVRQVLAEHVTVALGGGVLGILLAWTLVRSAALVGAAEVPQAAEVSIDATVLLFAFLVAGGAGVVSGLLPALRAARSAPGDALTSGTRGAVRGGRSLPGRLFVAAEIAMALMLVTGATLLVQSMRAVLARPLGFETEHVATAEITLGGPRYNGDSAAVLAYWDRLRQTAEEHPEVRAAGLTNWVPLVRGGTGFIEVEGKELPGAGAGYRMISEGYFEALGMRVLEGRSFDGSDRPGGPRVAVISRRMAERYWPGESALGRRVRAASMEPGEGGQPAPWLTVVGVVSDARPFGRETEETAEMYVLFRQLPAWRIGTMNLVARGTGGDAGLLRAVRETIERVDPGIPADVALMRTHADRVTASRRFTMMALLVFGALALALAAIGVFGVLSFAVAQRRREIAVRAALGADRGMLRRMVLASGGRLVLVGCAAGVLGAWYVAQLSRSMLFGVEPHDPGAYGIALLTIVAAGLLAALVPAVRAARTDPMQALRED